MKLSLEAVTLFAPGYEGWGESKQRLQNSAAIFTDEKLSKYSPQFLPANERRRTTATINLALRATDDLAQQYQLNTHSHSFDKLPVIFMSNDGDTDIAFKLCQGVMYEEPMVSPIQFHNSVHNAPAGYWMIGQHSQQPATSISAGDYPIAQGLLEAYFQSKEHDRPVVVVSYDLPVNAGIDFDKSCTKPCAVGFVLSHRSSDSSIATLSLSTQTAQAPLTADQWTEKYNPSSSGVALLTAIAKKDHSTLCYPFSAQRNLQVTLSDYS